MISGMNREVELIHPEIERTCAMPRKIEVSWSHTEDFTRTFEVDDDIGLDDKDAIEELICDLDQAELSEAFDGCTSRSIYNVTEATE